MSCGITCKLNISRVNKMFKMFKNIFISVSSYKFLKLRDKMFQFAHIQNNIL
jgi:hypothetical protein